MTDFMALQAPLPAYRYAHALRTARTAVLLAQRHGIDASKAEIAGLLHDCARGMDDDPTRMLSMAARFGLVPTKTQLLDPVVFLHAPLSAQLAFHSYGIRDADILQAIARHAHCAAGMTALDKALYIADLTEPGRKGMQAIFFLACENLPRSFDALFLHALRTILDNGWPMDDATAYVYNDILGARSGG